MLNVDFIWVHSSVTVMEATLSHSLNKEGTPTLVAEMGVGMRITKSYGDQLLDGIFNLMAEMGIWTGETKKVSHPIVSTDGNVSFIYSDTSGIFMPCNKALGRNIQGRSYRRYTRSAFGCCRAGNIRTLQRYCIYVA